MTAPTNDSPGAAPDRILIDAARHYARRTAGLGVQRITLTLSDGTKRKIEVGPAAPDEWPPADGWAVRGDRGACDGREFRLAGKSLAVFRELVAAGPEGVAAADLKRKVWDQFTDDRTVQNAVSRLRQAVREALALADGDDPVAAEGDRYRLREAG